METRKKMFKRTFIKVRKIRIPFWIQVVIVGSIVFMAISSADGASAGGDSSDSNRVVLATNGVEFEIARPLQVTLVWVGPQIDPGSSKVYPGQELAIGTVKIENQSPIRYGALLRPEPLIPGDSWPQLTLLYLDLVDGVEHQQHAPILLEPWTTVSVQARILVAWGAQPTSFRGLNLVVDAGPPPTETTAGCPAASGCG